MGSSKKVTVGYRYYLGMHLILCHGPVDKLTHIVIDKKTAWAGANTGGPLVISAADLFGGESREGGVSGTVDFETGSPTQGKNSYLMGRLGANISAFRGVAAAVLRQVYVGVNPYLKNWAFRVQRIHVRAGGDPQWYDAKAAVFNTGMVIAPGKSDWKYKVVPRTDSADYSDPDYDDSAWDVGPAPFSNFRDPSSGYWNPVVSHGFSKTPGTVVAEASKVWMRTTVNLTEVPDSFQFEAWIDNDCSFYVNGVLATSQGGPYGAYYSITIPASYFNVGTNHICAVGVDRDAGPGNWYYFDWRLRSQDLDVYDMNPAHIIRECLTDLDWGMGYLESDVDDASFTAAADQLYAEGFGISILWDRQTAIEDFVKEIIRHINAALYVDRTSGKFVLKLVRNDYDPDSLLVLGEGQVEKVENFARPAFGDMVNAVTVNYWDSATGTTASITAQDTALIQMQGAVVGTTIQYPGCTNPSLAARLASRDLTTLSTPLLSCTVYADRTASALNIGDVFKLDWPDLLAEPVVMRVMAMAFGDGRSNQIKITATEDVFALPEVAVIVPQPPEWVDPTSPPEAATKRAAQEAPYYELVQRLGQSNIDSGLAALPEAGYLQVSAARPGSAINATVQVDAGAGYAVESSMDFCAYGELAAAALWDDTVLTLTNVLDATLIEADTYAKLGDELVAVVSYAPLTGELTVKRGVLDTLPEAHAAGEGVFFLDEYANSDSSEYVHGESLDIKLQTATGSGVLPLASAPTDTVVMDSRAARPYPPADVKLNGEYKPPVLIGAIELTFETRNRLQQTATGSFLSWFDAGVALEPGVEVAADLYDTDTETVAASLSGITSPYDLVAGVGAVPTNCRLELFCRNTTTLLESRRVPLTFQYGYDLVGLVDGAARLATYSTTLTADGAVSPVTWGIASGSLPAGLHLVPDGVGNTATIQGVPIDANGYYAFTVQTVDANGTRGLRSYEIALGTYSMLMHMDGADNGTSFTDATGKAVTRGGSPVTKTDVVKVGSASARYPGSNSYTRVPYSADFDLSTADFTIDFWLYLRSKSGASLYGTVVEKRNSGADHDWTIINNNSTIGLQGRHVSSAGNAWFDLAGSSGSTVLNAWEHFRVARRGMELRAFRGGVEVNRAAMAYNLLNRSLTVQHGASRLGYGDSYLNANLDEFRIIKGAAMSWDSPFDPPLANSDYPQAAPAISVNGSLPAGSASVAYSSTTDVGIQGTGPFTVSVSSGALPSGWSAAVSGSNVTVSGPGVAAGLYTFTLEVADGSSNTARLPIALNINA